MMLHRMWKDAAERVSRHLSGWTEGRSEGSVIIAGLWNEM
jgi:hypothetical protein